MKQLFLALFFSFSLFQIAQAQCVSGDCNSGTGIFIYPSGAKYIGQFENGEIHGIGTCYYTDGSKYQGEWRNRFPEGRGTKTSSEGKTWTGQWLKGQPVNEQGELISDIFSDEEEDDGTNIQSGCLSGDCDKGKGVFAYADGSKYEGEFAGGKPDGKGTFQYANGERFVGNFKNGYKHGSGTYFNGNGKQTIGEWREGEYFGNPRLDYGKTGCLSGDCQNGSGIFIFENSAAKYVGAFKEGKANGQGTIYYANGEMYKGEWANGAFNGMGTLYLMDGTQVEGNWLDGTFAGNPEEETEEVLVEEETEEVPTTGLEIETEKEISVDDLLAFRNAADMKVWAVIIGIAAYDHMPTLRYTDDDAYRMYAFLKSPEGGALTDDQIRILIDEDATKDKIESTMKEIYRKAGENDLVFLYFSGHGLKGSFLPIDFDGFNNKLDHEDINKILESSPAKYKLCIADACHSGSLLAMKSGNVTNVLANYYKTLAQADAGTALIMSSKSDETSLESSGLRQGVFSHFLIRGLKGEADIDENKVVTIQELYDFINLNVRTYTGKRQSPVIKGDYDKNMTVSVVR